MKLLFVCTGNTCRSPMAEGLFRKKKEQQQKIYECYSAGLAAFPGMPASANAVVVCKEMGIDLSKHRSQPVTPKLLRETDLFLVMTPAHKQALLKAGINAEKIHVLGESIPDPYGGSLSEYRRIRDLLADAVDALLQKLEANP